MMRYEKVPRWDGNMYEVYVPVRRTFKWYRPGFADIDDIPTKGVKGRIASLLLWCIEKLGVHIRRNHEIVTSESIMRIREDSLEKLIAEINRAILDMGDRPWFVVVSPAMMQRIMAEGNMSLSGYPGATKLGSMVPGGYYRDGRIPSAPTITIVGDELPVYVNRYLNGDQYFVMPVPVGEEPFQRFEWRAKAITDKWNNTYALPRSY